MYLIMIEKMLPKITLVYFGSSFYFIFRYLAMISDMRRSSISSIQLTCFYKKAKHYVESKVSRFNNLNFESFLIIFS